MVFFPLTFFSQKLGTLTDEEYPGLLGLKCLLAWWYFSNCLLSRFCVLVGKSDGMLYNCWIGLGEDWSAISSLAQFEKLNSREKIDMDSASFVASYHAFSGLIWECMRLSIFLVIGDQSILLTQ